MNDIQIIDDVRIDWSKFKSKAKGYNLELAKKSYINLCKLMHSKGHKLLSDYRASNYHISVDMQCGHNPIMISPANYKVQNGDIKCPECIIMEDTIVSEEEPKYNKDLYIIGFYNQNIDDIVKLCNCNRVFNDITSLKYHLRNNDIVMLASEFSLYGIDKKEIQRIADTYNIDFRVYGNNDANLNTMLDMNEYVYNNKEIISKLI